MSTSIQTNTLYSAQFEDELPHWLSADSAPTTVCAHGDSLPARLLDSGQSLRVDVQVDARANCEVAITLCGLDEGAGVELALDGVDLGRQSVRRMPYQSRLRIDVPCDGNRHYVTITPIDGAMAFWRVWSGPSAREMRGVSPEEAASIFADHSVQAVSLLPSAMDQRPCLFLDIHSLTRLRKDREFYRANGWYRPMLPMGTVDAPPISGDAECLSLYLLTYLLEPEAAMLATIEKMLCVICEPEHWGAGREEDCDLQAAHGLYGLAVAIDWVGSDLSPEIHNLATEKIRLQARRMFELSLAGDAPWSLRFDQNHTYISMQGLLLAGIALAGEPEAANWIAWATHLLRKCIATFPRNDQGDFYEGPHYWDYSMPRLFRAVDVLQRCCGIDLLGDHPWFRATAYWRWTLNITTSNVHLNVADALMRSQMNWDALAYLARRYRDPVIQGMIDRFRPDTIFPQYTIWRDPDLESTNPDDALPKSAHYRDTGTVVMRDRWDSDANVLAFRCSPLGSHYNVARARAGERADAGHTHPDANSFLLFSAGQPLAMDDGYAIDKQTKNHNTLLIDGQGQVGSGEAWPGIRPDRIGQVTHAVLSDAVSAACGEAHELYDGIADLDRYSRWIVSFGERWFVVYDEIAAQNPHEIEWLLITARPLEALDAGRHRVTLGQSAMTVTTLYPELSWSNEPEDFVIYQGCRGPEHDEAMRTRGKSLSPSRTHRILTALIPHTASAPAPDLPVRVGKEETLGCRMGDDIVLFAAQGMECRAEGIEAHAQCAAVSKSAVFMADGTRLARDGELLICSTAPATLAATWSQRGIKGELSLPDPATLGVRVHGRVSSVKVNERETPFTYEGAGKMLTFEAAAGHWSWEVL
ncbi:MAG: heparinase II/III family protein [Capsulimonadaceae bacterium]|nr:heparinase II/III family protein [Capsulimonadaceae bacterium]